jgi:hypothetical protein
MIKDIYKFEQKSKSGKKMSKEKRSFIVKKVYHKLPFRIRMIIVNIYYSISQFTSFYLLKV